MAPKAQRHVMLLLSPESPVFIYLLLSTNLALTERNLFPSDPLKTSCPAVGTTQCGQKALDKGEQKQEAYSSNVLVRPRFVHHVFDEKF